MNVGRARNVACSDAQTEATELGGNDFLFLFFGLNK